MGENKPFISLLIADRISKWVQKLPPSHEMRFHAHSLQQRIKDAYPNPIGELPNVIKKEWKDETYSPESITKSWQDFFDGTLASSDYNIVTPPIPVSPVTSELLVRTGKELYVPEVFKYVPNHIFLDSLFGQSNVWVWPTNYPQYDAYCDVIFEDSSDQSGWFSCRVGGSTEKPMDLMQFVFLALKTHQNRIPPDETVYKITTGSSNIEIAAQCFVDNGENKLHIFLPSQSPRSAQIVNTSYVPLSESIKIS